MSGCCSNGPLRAHTADSDCIALDGTGRVANPITASPILDADPANLLTCSPAGLTAIAPPDLYVEGGVPPGSIPPIGPGVDIFGAGPDWPSSCGGFEVPIGPQADILVANPTDYSFLLVGTIAPAGAAFWLDPGARLQIGWGISSAGINLPPAPVTSASAIFYGGYNNTTPGCQSINPDAPIIDFGVGITLGPGDFIWFSMQTLILLVGAGPATTVLFIAGAGVRGSIRGVRL